MGRGKIEIKKIDNKTSRQVTFSKRRQGLVKKARELAVLCDVPVGLIVFSQSGKLTEYSTNNDMKEIIDKYQEFMKSKNMNMTRVQDTNNDNNQQLQVQHEFARLKMENEELESMLQRHLGENLAGLSHAELDQLEHRLDLSVAKVRARKLELLYQQLDNLRRKEHLLENDNNRLYNTLFGHHAAEAAAEEDRLMRGRLMFPFGTEPLGLQLFQPTQPNLQDTGFLGSGLQL